MNLKQDRSGPGRRYLLFEGLGCEAMSDVHPKVAAALDKAGVLNFRTLTHAPMDAPHLLTDALRYDCCRNIKTLLVANRAIPTSRRVSGPICHYAAVCLPAPWRADFAEIASMLEWPGIEMAGASELAALLDYPSGAVSPFGLGNIPLFLEKRC
jgi:prolyl-tRNA editing enzyme YbaK/EbsC (Cys-tRNA(Pro) deacylase)